MTEYEAQEQRIKTLSDLLDAAEASRKSHARRIEELYQLACENCRKRFDATSVSREAPPLPCLGDGMLG